MLLERFCLAVRLWSSLTPAKCQFDFDEQSSVDFDVITG